MRAAAVIPARAGSKNLPDKNALPVAGRPMIVRAIEAVRSAGPRVEKTIVSTDSPRVAQLARSGGAKVVERPAEFAGDVVGVEGAVRHALRAAYAAGELPEATIVVQPNLPIWQPGIVGKCLDRLERGDCTSAASCHLVDQRPEWMKRLDERGYAAPFLARDGAVAVHRQAFPELYYLDGAVVAVLTRVLLETASREKTAHYYLGERIAPVPRPELYGLEVHGPEDIAWAEILIAGLEQLGHPE